MGIELEPPRELLNGSSAQSGGCSRVLWKDRTERPIPVMRNGRTLAAGSILRMLDGFRSGPYALFPLLERP